MKYFIKELRLSLGLSQREFSSQYCIPLSTLCKWEQGVSSPPDYVISLIARTVPSLNSSLVEIIGDRGNVFYYDSIKKTISDNLGNIINISQDLTKIKSTNLSLYVQDLFDSFYEVQNKFNHDCVMDQKTH